MFTEIIIYMPAAQSKAGLYLTCWVEFSSGNILKLYFFKFPPKIQVFTLHADSLHEMTNPVF